MPIGIIVDVLSVFFGGVLGFFIGNKIDDQFKVSMAMIFGICSIGMGVSTIAFMAYMPAVVFAIILGTIIGFVIHLDDMIKKGAVLLQKPINKIIKKNQEQSIEQFITILILFCASGTGIYGSLMSGMTGDHSILLSKSILDFFTAFIFGCQLGLAVSIIAIPQFIIMIILFLVAGFIIPHTTPSMILDFKACGGFLMVATGLRQADLLDVPLAMMLPAMILVMPFSYLWVTFILSAL